MKNYQIFKDRFIVTEPVNRYGNYPDSDFQKSGMALCGMLKKNETLEHWKKRIGKNHLNNLMKNKSVKRD